MREGGRVSAIKAICSKCGKESTVFRIIFDQILCDKCTHIEIPLTLRDQFAMAALTGFTSLQIDPDADDGDIEMIARDCYALSDAMLEARKNDT